MKNHNSFLLSLFTRSFKHVNKKAVLGLSLFAAMGHGAMAQSSSYDLNTVPISFATNFSTAFGFGSLANPLLIGDFNTGTGYHTLFANVNGYYNTATGFAALENNVSGTGNTATGLQSMNANTTGNYNTADGYGTLIMNINGEGNTALGYKAMVQNTIGNNNVAVGIGALYSADADENTATGAGALGGTSFGHSNCAYGFMSAANNTFGKYNVSDGHLTLLTNNTGTQLTTIGAFTDVSVDGLNNATALGANAIVNANDKVRIGDATVTVVEGQVAYTFPSDGRFKTNVSETDVVGLEFIKKLRPVVYNFDTRKFEEFLSQNMPDSIRSRRLSKDFAPSTAVRQSGFIAQEVEQAAKEVGYNFNGVHKPTSSNDNYSVAYSQFVVPLVKAVQEQQAMIDDLKAQLADLKKDGVKPSHSLTPAVKGTETQSVELSDINSVILDQNAPNPFARQTTITYHVPVSAGKAEVIFYDTKGALVKKVDVTKGKGILNVYTDDLSNGTYTYVLVVDGKVSASKQMIKVD